jgi:hypothetical protein
MSVEAINWALKQETDEPVDKLILIALANYAGDDHSSFPSRRKLSEIGMCSLDTVDRANRRLEARGLVSKETRLHPAGGKASNCYILDVDGVAAPCGQGDEVSESRNRRTETAAQMRLGQPHDAARVAAQLSGEGSRTGCGHKEPPKEPPKEHSPLTPKGKVTALQALNAYEAYNALALRCAIPVATSLSPDRKRKIIARLKDHGLDGWGEALANIEKSSFLTGGGDNGWTVNLEWMLKPSNFTKLREGAYGNGRHSGKSTEPKQAWQMPTRAPERRQADKEAEWAQMAIDQGIA